MKYYQLDIAVFLIAASLGAGLMNWANQAERTRLQNRITAYGHLTDYNAYMVTCRTTQYTLHPNECSKEKGHRYFGITRSGRKAIKDWTVATDWSRIPEGAIVIDPMTHKKYRAEDTGNKVKGWHVDFFVGQGTPENVKMAQKYGMQERQLLVIE